MQSPPARTRVSSYRPHPLPRLDPREHSPARSVPDPASAVFCRIWSQPASNSTDRFSSRCAERPSLLQPLRLLKEKRQPPSPPICGFRFPAYRPAATARHTPRPLHRGKIALAIALPEFAYRKSRSARALQFFPSSIRLLLHPCCPRIWLQNGMFADQLLALANLRLPGDRKSTRLNSSHGYISYAVFCLKK